MTENEIKELWHENQVLYREIGDLKEEIQDYKLEIKFDMVLFLAIFIINVTALIVRFI